MRLTALIVGWGLALGWLALGSPECRASDWRTDFEAARREAQERGKPLLVHFWAEWCGPCRQMESAVFSQPGVQNALRSDVVAVKVNVDEHKDLSSRFGIEALPSDIFLEPGGDRLIESTGFRNPGEYVEMVQRAKARQADVLRLRQQRPPEQPQVAATTKPGAPADPLAAPMLDGYCPVTLWKSRKWIKGASEYRVEFRGQAYYLASEEAYKSFQQDPRRYTPRFLGCDPVIVWESDRAVSGTTKFAAFYDDELYLFSSAENRDRFKQDPDRFIRTRIVLQPEEIESVVR